MAGRASGTITRIRIWSSLAPSTRAASESSSGIVMKNCRSKKIVKASPKKVGTISGFSDPTQWMRTKKTYSGMIVTWVGSISVASTRMNTICRPRHRIRDRAYATGIEEATVPTVVSTAYTTVLEEYVTSGTNLKTVLKLRNWK